MLEASHYSRKAAGEQEVGIARHPSAYDLPTNYGVAARAVILAVDLRNSSNRAIKEGAYATYVTMHTLLPTFAFLINKAKGHVIGLRGDGLFAGFTIETADSNGQFSAESKMANGVKAASRCGKAMLEATAVIDECLRENEIAPTSAQLQVGVGIDLGNIVITKIGWADAVETTAYGPPVNWACKHTDGNSEIRISKEAKSMYPTTKGGRLRFSPADKYYRVDYPNDLKMLE